MIQTIKNAVRSAKSEPSAQAAPKPRTLATLGPAKSDDPALVAAVATAERAEAAAKGALEAAAGVVAAAEARFEKDPSDPAWADVQAMREARDRTELAHRAAANRVVLARGALDAWRCDRDVARVGELAPRVDHAGVRARFAPLLGRLAELRAALVEVDCAIAEELNAAGAESAELLRLARTCGLAAPSTWRPEGPTAQDVAELAAAHLRAAEPYPSRAFRPLRVHELLALPPHASADSVHDAPPPAPFVAPPRERLRGEALDRLIALFERDHGSTARVLLLAAESMQPAHLMRQIGAVQSTYARLGSLEQRAAVAAACDAARAELASIEAA